MSIDKLIKKSLVFGVISLFVISSFIQITGGCNVRTLNRKISIRDYDFVFNSYNLSEISNYNQYNSKYRSKNDINSTEIIIGSSSIMTKDPMVSPWPMYCHDIRHTGRSSYITADNPGDEKWRFRTSGASSSPIIDNNGIIYVGGHDLYAIYLNGTEKWTYNTGGIIQTCPAIDENGIIYVGTTYATYGDYLYAIYPNGTLKWKYEVSNIFSSPTLGSDGTIYFGDSDRWEIKALYPNGTLKWTYKTGHVIYSSPAIGLDGTIYCGSHDNNVYALYPNNGTLKWNFTTNGWIHGSPTVANDGTVYIGSDDGYLYALYPNNGSMKWRCNIGACYASPALDDNGTLYIGVWEKIFYAIFSNGTIKWKFYPRTEIWDSSASISQEGTIYFGTYNKDIIALYPNGMEKWKKYIKTSFSSPAIGADGTIYIGSDAGYMYAFGIIELKADVGGPYYGLINEPIQFIGSAQGGYSPYTWYWDFGDTYTSDEQNPTHIYNSSGNYTVTLSVTDNTGNISENITWAKIKESNNPPNKPTVTGETSGKAGKTYDFDFMSVDPDGDEWVWYYIDWDDGSFEDWIGPYKPEKVVTVGHMWSEKKTYIIRAKARDNYGGESEWGELKVTMPKTKQSTNWWFLHWLNKFPILQKFIEVIQN